MSMFDSLTRKTFIPRPMEPTLEFYREIELKDHGELFLEFKLKDSMHWASAMRVYSEGHNLHL